jgi:hypothetical protein
MGVCVVAGQKKENGLYIQENFVCVAGHAGGRRRSRDVLRSSMVPPGQQRLPGSPLAFLQHIIPQMMPGCQLQHATGAAGNQPLETAQAGSRQRAAGAQRAGCARTLPQAASRAARISSSLCPGTFMRRPGLQRPPVVEQHYKGADEEHSQRETLSQAWHQ